MTELNSLPVLEQCAGKGKTSNTIGPELGSCPDIVGSVKALSDPSHLGSGLPNPNFNYLCCYNNEVRHLFEHLGPTPHQTVFLEPRGASLLCLKAQDRRTTV